MTEEKLMQQAFRNIESKLDSITSRMNDLEKKITNMKEMVDQNSEDTEESYEKPDDSPEAISDFLLNNFDFEKVSKVMEYLNWRWAKYDSVSGRELKEEASKMLNQAWIDLENQEFDAEGWREWFISCGGLEVLVLEGDERNGNKRKASLKFILEDCDFE